MKKYTSTTLTDKLQLAGIILLFALTSSCKKEQSEPIETSPQTSALQKIVGLYSGNGTDTTGNTFYLDQQVEVTPVANTSNVLISPVNHNGFDAFIVKVYQINVGSIHTVSTIADPNYNVVLDVLVDPYILYFEGANINNENMTFSGTKLP